MVDHRRRRHVRPAGEHDPRPVVRRRRHDGRQRSGLQWGTVRNLLMAWVLTLPVSIAALRHAVLAIHPDEQLVRLHTPPVVAASGGRRGCAHCPGSSSREAIAASAQRAWVKRRSARATAPRVHQRTAAPARRWRPARRAGPPWALPPFWLLWPPGPWRCRQRRAASPLRRSPARPRSSRTSARGPHRGARHARRPAALVRTRVLQGAGAPTLAPLAPLRSVTGRLAPRARRAASGAGAAAGLAAKWAPVRRRPDQRPPAPPVPSWPGRPAVRPAPPGPALDGPADRSFPAPEDWLASRNTATAPHRRKGGQRPFPAQPRPRRRLRLRYGRGAAGTAAAAARRIAARARAVVPVGPRRSTGAPARASIQARSAPPGMPRIRRRARRLRRVPRPVARRR